MSDLSITFKAFAIPNVSLLALGRDGNVWFVGGIGGTEYGYTTPTGGVTSATLPTSATAIASNRDGNIYVASKNSSTCLLYQVHEDLSFTSFPYTCSVSSRSMISGYDGRIWLADEGYIERIDTKGHQSRLQMSAGVDWITRGNSTGKAMFAGVSLSVDRIAPGDVITSVPLWMTAWGPTLAHDGSLWGATGDDDYLVKLNDDLTYSTWALPNDYQMSGPYFVTAGNEIVWTAAALTSHLYRFNSTEDHLMRAWNTPRFSDLIDGPNKTLWGTDGNRVYVGTYG